MYKLHAYKFGRTRGTVSDTTHVSGRHDTGRIETLVRGKSSNRVVPYRIHIRYINVDTRIRYAYCATAVVCKDFQVYGYSLNHVPRWRLIVIQKHIMKTIKKKQFCRKKNIFTRLLEETFFYYLVINLHTITEVF